MQYCRVDSLNALEVNPTLQRLSLLTVLREKCILGKLRRLVPVEDDTSEGILETASSGMAGVCFSFLISCPSRLLFGLGVSLMVCE